MHKFGWIILILKKSWTRYLNLFSTQTKYLISIIIIIITRNPIKCVPKHTRKRNDVGNSSWHHLVRGTATPISSGIRVDNNRGWNVINLNFIHQGSITSCTRVFCIIRQHIRVACSDCSRPPRIDVYWLRALSQFHAHIILYGPLLIIIVHNIIFLFNYYRADARARAHPPRKESETAKDKDREKITREINNNNNNKKEKEKRNRSNTSGRACVTLSNHCNNVVLQ